jgi:hypothetical protein
MTSEYYRIQAERDSMNARYDRQIADLRATCPHTESTKWLEGERGWVSLCRRCMKTVEEVEKRWCREPQPDRPPARYVPLTEEPVTTT